MRHRRRADLPRAHPPGLRWGRLFALYLVWYGLGRTWLEALRIDPTSTAPLGVPANIWTAGAAVLLGVGIFVVQGRRHAEPETSVYVPGREPAQEAGDAEPAGTRDDRA